MAFWPSRASPENAGLLAGDVFPSLLAGVPDARVFKVFVSYLHAENPMVSGMAAAGLEHFALSEVRPAVAESIVETGPSEAIASFATYHSRSVQKLDLLENIGSGLGDQDAKLRLCREHYIHFGCYCSPVAAWMNHEQQQILDYLREENRILDEPQSQSDCTDHARGPRPSPRQNDRFFGNYRIRRHEMMEFVPSGTKLEMHVRTTVAMLRKRTVCTQRGAICSL